MTIGQKIIRARLALGEEAWVVSLAESPNIAHWRYKAVGKETWQFWCEGETATEWSESYLESYKDYVSRCEPYEGDAPSIHTRPRPLICCDCAFAFLEMEAMRQTLEA